MCKKHSTKLKLTIFADYRFVADLLIQKYELISNSGEIGSMFVLLSDSVYKE